MVAEEAVLKEAYDKNFGTLGFWDCKVSLQIDNRSLYSVGSWRRGVHVERWSPRSMKLEQILYSPIVRIYLLNMYRYAQLHYLFSPDEDAYL